MSKSHPEQWTVREVAERPDRSLVIALREFATTQIADCGGPVAVVGPPLRHLAGGTQLCGPAVTVWTKPGDILYVLKAVDSIVAGDVLVVDGGSRLDAAVIGDIAGQALAPTAAATGWSSTAPSATSTVSDAVGVADVRLGRPSRDGIEPGSGCDQRRRAVRRGDHPSREMWSAERPQRPRRPRPEGTPRAGTRLDQDGRRPHEEEWRQAIARGASLPAATGIDDLISKLAADRAAA